MSVLIQAAAKIERRYDTHKTGFGRYVVACGLGLGALVCSFLVVALGA